MKVWIVEGSTGEYEDQHDWIAKAFISKERAESFEIKLNGVLREKRLHYDNVVKYNRRIPNELSKLDPHVDVDYTGTNYSLYSIDVEE